MVNVAHVLVCVSEPLWVVLMLIESAVLGVRLVGQETVSAAERVRIGPVQFREVVVMVDFMTSPAQLA